MQVLSQAPCSVGILVDRGLGGAEQIDSASNYLHVVVVFIGGADDREALAYAGRLAHHPGVKLTAIRFLDEGVEHSSMAGSSVRLMTDYKRQDQEARLDDECFAEFYERCVAGGPVNYVEKYVSNGAETAATLRALESHYSLFVAGHAGRGESPLTAGMGEWQECPELGPIGDLLSASDFSQTASVLIIQQHNPLRLEEETLDDDFSFR